MCQKASSREVTVAVWLGQRFAQVFETQFNVSKGSFMKNTRSYVCVYNSDHTEH